MPSVDTLDLTEPQLDAVARTYATLHPGDRDSFLRDLTARLKNEVVGDGLLFRVLRELTASGCYRPLATVEVGTGASGTVRKRPRLWRKMRSA
jgi:hypothetical protein